MSSSSKQKVVQVASFNAEDPAAAVNVVEQDIPEPKEGEVLVRVNMRPVNPADIFSIQGVYPGFAPPSLPAVPGLDGCGVIERCGPGTSNKFSTGQRVVGAPWGTRVGNGSWAQYVTIPEKSLVAVPNSLKDEEACQYFVNPITAMGFLDEFDIHKGDWILSNAAGSVLGRMLIKLCKHKGVKTINLVRRRELVQELKDLGADEVLVTGEDDISARVKEITGGKGAKVSFECVGGVGTAELLKATADGGTLVLYGAMGGVEFTGHIPDILFRNVAIRGFWLNVWLNKMDGQRRGQVLQETMDLMEKKVLEPYVGKKFPLEKVKEAIEESGKPGRGGKVLLEG